MRERHWTEAGYHLYSRDDAPAFLDWGKSTFDEMLSYRAYATPELKQTIILGDGENITAEITAVQAHERAMRVAGLLARFLPERTHVLLCLENSIEALVGFFGCAYANMIPVSGVYPTAPGSVERLFDILEDSGAKAVLGLRQVLVDFRRLGNRRAPDVRWIPIEGADQAEPLYRRHAGRVEDVAYVQYTSGSVGRPRGVQITHSSLGSNLVLLLNRSDFRSGVRGISWLPLSHDMGLVTGLFMGVVMGGSCLLMTPRHFIEKPERWLKAISRYKLGFSAAPNFAYDLCTRQVPDAALEELDLSCWEKSIIGAEMIERDTVAHFLRRFGPLGAKSSLFRPGYGMAETTLLIASGSSKRDAVIQFEHFSRSALAQGVARPAERTDDERVLVSCGKVIEGHTIAVVDPDTGQELEEGRVGELWLGGPSIARGYLNREEETRERFGLVLNGKPFFRSRDMGFFHKGQLYVTGRLDHRVMIDGQAFDPDDLATIIRSASSAFVGRGIAVFRQAEGLCVVGEVAASLSRRQGERVMETVAQALSRVCPVRTLRVVLARAGGISRTPSGKMRLAATREALEVGALPCVVERFFRDDELGLVTVLGQDRLGADG